MTLGGAKFKTTIDSGATINVTDHGTFRAFAYDTTLPVEFLEKFDAVIETKKKFLSLPSMLPKAQKCENLLSLTTAQDLGLISLHIEKLTSKDAAIENNIQKNIKRSENQIRHW